MLSPSGVRFQGDDGRPLWVRKHNGVSQKTTPTRSSWPWPPAASRCLPQAPSNRCEVLPASGSFLRRRIGWRKILHRLSKCGTLTLKVCWRNLGGSACAPFLRRPLVPGAPQDTIAHTCRPKPRPQDHPHRHTRQLAGVPMATDGKAGDLVGAVGGERSTGQTASFLQLAVVQRAVAGQRCV